MKDSLNRVLSVEAVAEKEWVAGVPRKALFGGLYWKGFKGISEEEMYELMSQNLQFRPRTEDLEQDETFKQITEYFLVRRDNNFFSSVRKSSGGDTRLYGARLIGFGGHIRKGDIVGPMKDWLKREFKEEIVAERIDDISYLGVVNDDFDPRGVSQVHFGLVFVVDVSGNVSINEKPKFEGGEFFSAEELGARLDEMESYSQIIVGNLLQSPLAIS